MEVIEDRHGKTSLIITSLLSVSKWQEVIGGKTIADAILDCMVHDAHRLELKENQCGKSAGHYQKITTSKILLNHYFYRRFYCRCCRRLPAIPLVNLPRNHLVNYSVIPNIERFNGSYRRKILDAYLFFDLEEVRHLTGQWIEEYNTKRPHEALGNLTPSQWPVKNKSGNMENLPRHLIPPPKVYHIPTS